ENPGGGAPVAGVSILRFRSEESAEVTPDPAVCAAAPFTTNVVFGAYLYSETTTADEGRVTNTRRKRIGTATACARITDPTFPPDLRQEFYVRFRLPEGSFTARGGCTLITNDIPADGLVLAGCHLRVIDAPSSVKGGVVSSLSVFNPRRLPGFETGSEWTIQHYK
ncbi:MAG TPA: hypothetical protein VF625_09565, partial [Longimicrobium sp.]